MRKNTGITVISLIITILVLVIIAGITVSLITGENGILQQSNESVDDYNKMAAKEKFDVAVLKSVGDNGEIDDEELIKEIEKVGGTFLEDAKVDSATVKYPAKVNIDGYEFIVEKDMREYIKDVESTVQVATGMIPVNIGTSEITKADMYNENNTWFDYDSQRWANIALVTDETRDKYINADLDTVVNEEDILGLYVWIPKYAYSIYDVENFYSQNTIDVVLLTEGTSVPNGYSIPSIFEDNNVEKGVWVAKYELSSANGNIETNDSNTLRSLNTEYTLAYIDEASFVSIVNKMIDENNSYGLSTEEVASKAILNEQLAVIEIFNNSKYGETTSSDAQLSQIGKLNIALSNIDISQINFEEQNQNYVVEKLNFNLNYGDDDYSSTVNTPPVILGVTFFVRNGFDPTPEVVYAPKPKNPIYAELSTLTGQIEATDPEGDPLTYSIVGNTQGTLGTISIDHLTGAFMYVVREDIHTAYGINSETFTAAVTDSNGGMTTVTINIDIRSMTEGRNIIVFN